ncbi:hypothetical protein HYPBUDRAFT_163965 [Hyphopichia burtonii NRRL Y-1933]|uniref:Uncharacterized protein n=1 Tax=Hyphopichia burtonii NRRL Y-1933 TaxID=984485 RepID=A0A1E4RQ10_9ASCO|nr:hypothetical protein HYPBUDRAFT_163965 [Hyphopichia burtonii NRRL Y-1933]ODV69316.1 hypothetical protein HYPBUDRAFT_163965 [Hyphopichia burtonii NRRL Y-1933]
MTGIGFGEANPPKTPPGFSYTTSGSSASFTTPPKRKYSVSHSNKRQKTLPSTPEATPNKTPRSIRKKAKDIILTPPQSSQKQPFQTPRPAMFSFGMFLPTPLTVGSGRKFKQKPSEISDEKLPQPELKDSKELNEDGDYLDHELISKPKKSISETLKALAGSNDTEVKETRSCTPPPLAAASKNLPATPQNNIIDDKLVNEWHAKSFNRKKIYSDVEDDDEIDSILQNGKSNQISIPNPFVDSKLPNPSKFNSKILNSLYDDDEKEEEKNHKLSNPFGISIKLKVDFSSQAEFINHKTGERVIRELSDKEKSIKPKKLLFDLDSSPPPSNSTPSNDQSNVSTTNLPGTTPRPKPTFVSSPFTSSTSTPKNDTPTTRFQNPFNLPSNNSTPIRYPIHDKKMKVNNNIQNKKKADELIDNSIGKKFILKNLNDFMVDGKSKNNLGFEIFKDDD